jgi:hypothetical protein
VKHQVLLTDEQVRDLALDWIKSQQGNHMGYKLVLGALFRGAHEARWSWMDALKYAAILCCKQYAVGMTYIKENLK